MDIIINDQDDMIYLAKLFANLCEKKDTILLNGDLGAGKTFFTKHLASELGVKDNVISPTFTLAKEYVGDLELFHIDAYRLEGSNEDMSYVFDYYANGVTVIEWPEFICDYLPYSYVQLYIEVIGETKRKISLSFINDNKFESVVKEYEQYFNSRYK